MLELGSEFKGLIDEQISSLLTPKYIITGLDIGTGIGIETYKTELSKAKLIVFFLKTRGSVLAQGFYMKSMTNGYNKYCLGNNTNTTLGIYIGVMPDGTLNVSDYEYDGYTKITGFATFY